MACRREDVKGRPPGPAAGAHAILRLPDMQTAPKRAGSLPGKAPCS